MIIIFHLFERTRCDPLSVGIKSKNGGEQSGVDISLFRVYFERVNKFRKIVNLASRIAFYIG